MNEQLAFKLGRAFKLGMMYGLGRTYADLGKARDAEKDPEEWITSRGTHIPVGKSGKLEGKVGEKIERQTQKNQKFKLDDFTRDLDRGKSPRAVLKEAAQSLKGSYSVSLPGIGMSNVILGKSFVDESGKYLYMGEGKANPKKRKEIAKRQLFGMSKLQTILTKGIKTRWTHDPKHNEDYDFLTVYKKFLYQGENVLFSVDISRKREDPKHPRPKIQNGLGYEQVYNIGNSKNQGFSKKQKHAVFPITPVKDAAPTENYEIVRIRF